MNSITYLILLYNNEKNLSQLVHSLKNIKGNFRKEYIVIDDCSTDNTIEKAQELFASFPRATLLSNHKYQGPAYSVNLALKLVSHDYVHFIDGGDIVTPNSTETLLKAAITMGSEVSCALHGMISKTTGELQDNIRATGDIILIDSPIKDLLENRRVPDIRYIGYSGTLIAARLLEKISGADKDVFLHNMSLGLRCGKYSKFAFVKQTLYYASSPMERRYNNDFLSYNTLLAVLNFMENHREIAEQYKAELYKSLWSILWYLEKFKIKTLPKYFLSRYIKHNLDLDMMIDLYKDYIGKLER